MISFTNFLSWKILEKFSTRLVDIDYFFNTFFKDKPMKKTLVHIWKFESIRHEWRQSELIPLRRFVAMLTCDELQELERIATFIRRNPPNYSEEWLKLEKEVRSLLRDSNTENFLERTWSGPFIEF